LRRVVQNLVENAIHAVSGKTGKECELSPYILVATSCQEGRIKLIIEDNGIGMDENTVKRAFEPLFTTRAQGTGLGLAIVRKIVEEHGGVVSISSTLECGTLVTVELPAEI
jgi:signal transduction histidine kinase